MLGPSGMKRVSQMGQLKRARGGREKEGYEVRVEPVMLVSWTLAIGPLNVMIYDTEDSETFTGDSILFRVAGNEKLEEVIRNVSTTFYLQDRYTLYSVLHIKCHFHCRERATQWKLYTFPS